MTTTVANLPRITATDLSSLILAHSPNQDPSIAIIDVRDDDHIGGHILGSQHVPSQTLDYKMPELVRKLKDKGTVVFHCALSQQRGPGAALRYVRERERLVMKMPQAAGTTATAAGDEKLEGQELADSPTEGQLATKEQKVYVLHRGFVGWQEKFGDDERLTESYSKELWKDGYWM